MSTVLTIYYCNEPDNVVRPLFKNNYFKGIFAYSPSLMERLKSTEPEEYHKIMSDIDNKSAIINGANECTIYTSEGLYANSKTLFKIPKEDYDKFYNSVFGIRNPTAYSSTYEHIFKLKDENYCKRLSDGANLQDIIIDIINKYDERISGQEKGNRNNNQSEEKSNNLLDNAINAMTGD